MLGQQIGSAIGGLLALAQHYWCQGAFGQLIKTQQRARLRQTLPAPSQRVICRVFAPGEGREHFAWRAALIRPEVEAVQHHKWLTVGVTVNPNLGRFTVLPVRLQHLQHCLLRNGQHGHPLWFFSLTGGSCDVGFARRLDTEEGSQFVTRLHI